MADQVLLTDEEVQKFIVDGVISFQSGIDPSINRKIHELLQYSAEYEMPLGNNFLSRVPDIYKILRCPRVSGALTSLLGPNYLIHPHRAIHRSTPVAGKLEDFTLTTNLHHLGKGSTATSLWHQDGQSPLARARHHLPKYLIGFYCPHDVTKLMGPTRFKLGSYMHQSVTEITEVTQPDFVSAGTFMLCHFDIVHAGFPNQAKLDRFLIKFVFARTSYPVRAYWNHNENEWKKPTGASSRDELKLAWHFIWNWMRGDDQNKHGSSGVSKINLSNHLSEQGIRVNNIYASGKSSELESLKVSLLEKAGLEKHVHEPFMDKQGNLISKSKSHDNSPRWNEKAVVMEDEAYRLVTFGEDAIDLLIEILANEDPWMQINAAFALGELGFCNPEVIKALTLRLESNVDQVVRQSLDALACMSLGFTDDTFDALEKLIKTSHTSWQEHLVPRGWTGQDQIRMNLAMVLLNAAVVADQHPRIEDIAGQLLADPNGYASAIAAETLIRINSPTSLSAGIQYLSDRRWDETLRVHNKRY